jgi:Uma2 family endonuclease
MVGGDPLEDEPMTATLPLADADLLSRDDLTVDDIADLPEDLRYELIEGRLVLTPRGTPTHGFLSKRVGDAVEVNSPEEFVLNIEQAVRIGPRTELQPDVVLMHEKGAGGSPVRPADVLLVVEVISKSSKVHDREYKLKQYAHAGIPNYWIVDPLASRVTFAQFVLGGDGVYLPVVETDELITVYRPWEVTLDLPAWTRRRDRIRRAARRDR